MLNGDKPLQFHKSLDNLLDTFSHVILSVTWLKSSVITAKKFYESFPYVIDLTCSTTTQSVKVGKYIFIQIEKEGLKGPAPLYSKTLINFYRVFTIAVKDIIWEEPDFKPFLKNSELHFLWHLRNASAHNNKFFFGKGKQRNKTIKRFPISWRGKVIDKKLEGTILYMDFMKPGDIFLLLSDISGLI